jgi:signal peptidase I
LPDSSRRPDRGSTVGQTFHTGNWLLVIGYSYWLQVIRTLGIAISSEMSIRGFK